MPLPLAAVAIPAAVSALGTVAGAISGQKQAQATRNAKNQYKTDMNQAIGEYTSDANTNLDQYYAGVNNANNALSKAMAEYSAGLDGTKLNFNKDNYSVDKFYAPNRDALIDAVAQKAQGSASMAGMGRSSDAVTGIATAVADKNEELYNNALSAMQDARNFDYNYAKDARDSQLNALKEKLGLAQTSNSLTKEGLERYKDNNALKQAVLSMKSQVGANSI